MIPFRENRGAVRKYEFTDMNVGEIKAFNCANTQNLLNAAKYWAKTNNKDWKFICFTHPDFPGVVGIKRIQ